MFVDSHCHIDIKNLKHDLLEAKKANVDYILANATDINECYELLELTKKYDNIKVALGFHPSVADNVLEQDFEKLEKLLSTNKNILAIGEIGLDFYYGKNNHHKQIEVLERLLALAKKYKKPVIIHSRKSNDTILTILKKYNLKGIIHCFSGSKKQVLEFINLGYLIGVNGIITFDNANELRNVIANISLDYIVLETDAPYLTPKPDRGKINSSKYIPIIAKKLSELKNCDIETVASKTTNNFWNLFDN